MEGVKNAQEESTWAYEMIQYAHKKEGAQIGRD